MDHEIIRIVLIKIFNDTWLKSSYKADIIYNLVERLRGIGTRSGLNREDVHRLCIQSFGKMERLGEIYFSSDKLRYIVTGDADEYPTLVNGYCEKIL